MINSRSVLEAHVDHCLSSDSLKCNLMPDIHLILRLLTIPVSTRIKWKQDSQWYIQSQLRSGISVRVRFSRLSFRISDQIADCRMDSKNVYCIMEFKPSNSQNTQVARERWTQAIECPTQFQTLVANWIQSFSAEADSAFIDTLKSRQIVQKLIHSKTLFVLMNQQMQPVTMLSCSELDPNIDLISSVYTPQIWRRNGYSKSLLFQTVQRQYEKGRRVFLVVRAENKSAINLYESLGFKKEYWVTPLK